MGIACSAVAPKIPAAVRVRCRGGGLWIQNDDVVGRSPAIIASVADEVIVNATHVLLAAMKGYMQATWLGGALGRHIQVSYVIETNSLVSWLEEFGLIERH